MAAMNKQCFKLYFLLILLILVANVKCRGGGRTSGSRPSSSHRPSSRPSSPPSHHISTGTHHTSSPSYRPSSSGTNHISGVGHSNSYRPSSGGGPYGGTSSGGGYHPPSSGISSHPSTGNIGFGPHGSISSTHTITGGVGINPSHVGGKPSAPVGPPSSRPGIGFDHVNQGVHVQTNTHTLNSGKPIYPSAPVGPPPAKPGIGFDNVNHNTPTHSSGPTHVQTNTHTLNSGKPLSPSAPISRPGIGFDNVNKPQTHQPINSNVHHPVGNVNTGTHHPYPVQPGSTHYGNAGVRPPYQPQTIVHPSGSIQYRPPLQPQYTPPVQTVHHVVPIYQPVTIYKSYPTYSGGYSGASALGYGGSFLGGYLVGRMLSPSYHSDYHHHHYHTTHNTYDNNYIPDNQVYYRDERPNQQTVIYSVHHYHQNREDVAPKFSITGENTKMCPTNTSENLCSPNTNSLCLKNETIMCVTHMPFVVSCDAKTNLACVYSRIDCAGQPPCDKNQTYIDFYLPCISNVTLVNDKVLDHTTQNVKVDNAYELCVTAIAEPKKLESPVSAWATFIGQLGAYHIKSFSEAKKIIEAT